MSVVEGHVAAKVAHIGLSVEVRHAQRLHQRGMRVAEFMPRDLDAQPRRNWIQDPVGDVLEHVMMAGLRTKHEVIWSYMVTPCAEHLQFLHDLGRYWHIAVPGRGFGPAEFTLVKPARMRAALGANISPSATMASSSRFRRCQRSAKNSDRKSTRLNSSHSGSSYAVF